MEKIGECGFPKDKGLDSLRRSRFSYDFATY